MRRGGSDCLGDTRVRCDRDRMTQPPQSVSFFARTTFRDQRQAFGIRQNDRMHHLYLIGKTGVGKSTLMATLMKQDIEAGRGLVLLDPHGELASQVLASVPASHAARVTYFNVPDNAEKLGFNPLEYVPTSRRGLVAAGIMESFKRLWGDSWGPRLEYILRNAVFLLLEQRDATLADILRLLSDVKYRKSIASLSKNAEVRRFWLEEYEGYPARLRAEAAAPVQNKVGACLTDPILRDILTAPRNRIRLRRIMDSNGILIVNLSKGRVGEETAALLGSLLISRLSMAALSRADQPAAERRDFFIYIDEFQTFTSLSSVTMLSELRKYRVGMVLAHQYLEQLDARIKEAILGNIGTPIVFRLGATDAEVFAQEFYPYFSDTDITNLPNRHIYLKLMIDGRVSVPFSAETIAPEELQQITVGR